MYRDPRQQYRTQQVATASPAELVGMLYDAVLRDLRSAAGAIRAADPATAGVALVKAQDIVLELRLSLNHSAGGELATRLDDLYGFVYARLVKANLAKDEALVQECIAILEPLQDAWNTACRGRTVPGAAAS